VRSELTAEECLQMGFNRNNLLCSSCNLLEKFDLALLRLVVVELELCKCL